jgi:hypothetical protein
MQVGEVLGGDNFVRILPKEIKKNFCLNHKMEPGLRSSLSLTILDKFTQVFLSFTEL